MFFTTTERFREARAADLRRYHHQPRSRRVRRETRD